MTSTRRLVFPLLLSTSLACTFPDDQVDERVEIGANALQQAFLAEERAARERFDGKDLVIFGEVVRAFPRFRGTTMEGEVTNPSYVEFRTVLDTLPTDIKYVQVEGEFDVPDSLELWAVDSRIRVGDSLRDRHGLTSSSRERITRGAGRPPLAGSRAPAPPDPARPR